MFYVCCLILSTDASVAGIAGRDILTAILDLNPREGILILKALVLGYFIMVVESVRADYLGAEKNVFRYSRKILS